MKQTLQRLNKAFKADKKESVRTLLITEGFGFCVSLSFVLGYSLDRFDTIFYGAKQLILSILCVAFLTQIVTAIAMIIWAYKKDKPELVKNTLVERTLKERMLQWGIVTFAITLLWLPIYLAYFPSVFSYDAEIQLYQVISGNYSTHHPLIHTLIMGMFMKMGYGIDGINVGMALYSAVQLLIMAIIIGAALTFPWKKKRPIKKVWVIVLTLFFGVFPVFGILAISTTKDIYFAGLALLMTLMLLDVDTDVCPSRYICIGIVATILLLFRNNAVYAMVVFLAILTVLSIKKKSFKMLLTLAGSLLLAVCILGGLKYVLKAESGSPREALAIPIQQMARVKVLHASELEPDISSNLNRLIDDEWANRYDEHLADPIKERISMKEPSLFVKTWILLGLKYPGTYIDAWLLTTQGAWYIPDKSCNRIYGEGQTTGFGYLSTDIRNMPEGFEVTNKSQIADLRNLLEKLVSDNEFERVPILNLVFSPALYFWLFVLFLYNRIIYRDKQKIIAVTFLTIYFLTILLSPAILVRYMLPYMYAAPILLVSKNDNN